jgi:uncharacterized protein YjbI with pentapeptide repeats
VIQTTPEDAVGSRQIIILENDQFGNQRKITIGSGGSGTQGPQPCDKEKPVAAMNCSHQALSGVEWEGVDLTNSWFDGADLSDATLARTKLANVSFTGAKLRNTDLSRAALVNCDFENADLAGAKLDGANIVNAGFQGANLQGADLSGSTLINADFEDAQLAGAVWVDGRTCGEGSQGHCAK